MHNERSREHTVGASAKAVGNNMRVAPSSASSERLKAWCHEWIRPVEPDRNVRGADYERVCSTVLSRHVQDDEASVSTLTQKHLRLRRHARTPPRGFSFNHKKTKKPKTNNTNNTNTKHKKTARRG